MNVFSRAGTRVRKWYVWLPLGLLVLWLVFQGYRAFDQGLAASELRKMGFEVGSRDFVYTLRTNWRLVFDPRYYKSRQAWNGRARLLHFKGTDLNACGPALVRFRPREVMFGMCRNLEDVSTLRQLPDLERLDFYECPKIKNPGIVGEFVKLRELTFRKVPALRNLEIIRSGANLTSLHISDCNNLQDLRALPQFTSLRSLYLSGIPAIHDTELLRGLVLLEELDLSGCSELSNIDGLLGLKSLKSINLSRCPKISVESMAALREALPNAKIDYF